MAEDLDNRKKRILQAIIEEYIETAEPVSSGNSSNTILAKSSPFLVNFILSK